MATIKVAIGNTHPRVGHKNPDGTTTYGSLPEGEYVTEVYVNEDGERMLQVIKALTLHVADGKTPAWIDCEDKNLLAGLVRYYRIQNNNRPEHWGGGSNQN